MAQPNYPYQGGEQQPPVPPPYGGVQYPGGAAPPMPPSAPPPKKSNVGKIILIVLAALLVLCVGGGVAAYFLLKDEVAVATQTRVVAPDTLAGRAKVTQPELQAASETMVADLRSELPDATSAVGAFYGDVLTGDLIMIAAVSGLVADPAKEVDESFAGMSGSGLTVTNIQAVDPGPLGGEAKCGDGTSEGISLGVCSWADRGSIGMVVMYNKTGAEAATEFVGIRGAIEQQG